MRQCERWPKSRFAQGQKRRGQVFEKTRAVEKLYRQLDLILLRLETTYGPRCARKLLPKILASPNSMFPRTITTASASSGNLILC